MRPPLPTLHQLLVGTTPVCLGWDASAFASEAELTQAEREAGLSEGALTGLRRFAAGRRAARAALGVLTGERQWEIVRERGGPHPGRPLVRPALGLDVSISHCGGISAAAAAHGVHVGVKLFDEASDWGDEDDALSRVSTEEDERTFELPPPVDRRRLAGAVKVALLKASNLPQADLRKLKLVAWDMRHSGDAHAFALSVESTGGGAVGGWFSGVVRRKVYGRLTLAVVTVGL